MVPGFLLFWVDNMKKRTAEILKRMEIEYGLDLTCYLNHDDAWQLLIATIMSAQCTDKRVNEVTKDLFVKYPDIKSFAEADLSELEKDIHSVGFYHNKAKNIIACCRMLHNDFNDEVPSDIDLLTTLKKWGICLEKMKKNAIFAAPLQK